MNELVQGLRDLVFSLQEHPAEWPEDLLAEVGSLGVQARGLAETERLKRALTND